MSPEARSITASTGTVAEATPSGIVTVRTISRKLSNSVAVPESVKEIVTGPPGTPVSEALPRETVKTPEPPFSDIAAGAVMSISPLKNVPTPSRRTDSEPFLPRTAKE